MLGLLIWGILCISGFILYDKFLSEQKNESKLVIKEKQETQKESSKEELLDIYSDQVQKLYEKTHLRASQCWNMELDENNMSLEEFKKQAFYFAAFDYFYESKKEFTYDDVNKEAKKIFGKDFNLEDKEYILANYDYDNSSKTYKFNAEGFGCTASEPVTDIHLYKAVKKDKQISLYESVIYSHVENEKDEYFYDSTFIKKEDSCHTNYLTNKECIENSPRYKFVFTIEDDNYVLTDIQKVEE